MRRDVVELGDVEESLRKISLEKTDQLPRIGDCTPFQDVRDSPDNGVSLDRLTHGADGSKAAP